MLNTINTRTLSDLTEYGLSSPGRALKKMYEEKEKREGKDIEKFIDKVIQHKRKTSIQEEVDLENENDDYFRETTRTPITKHVSVKHSTSSKLLPQNLVFSFESPEKEKVKEPELKGKCIFDKSNSNFHQKLLENNKTWIDCCTSTNPNYFQLLAQPQKPSCLVISCSDSRVVVNDCLGLKPGELFSHRNVGNLVVSTDFNVQSVIQYAVQVLKVEHLIVVGHTDCGAVKSALTSKYHGLIDHWLRAIREIAEKYRDDLEEIKKCTFSDNGQGKDEYRHALVNKVIELNVKEQVLSLCKTPIVQKAWKNGQTLFVHGYVLEIETGRLIDLDIRQEEWEEIEETYKFDFEDN